MKEDLRGEWRVCPGCRKMPSLKVNLYCKRCQVPMYLTAGRVEYGVRKDERKA